LNKLVGTEYEESDPNVKKYGLNAYLGHPVILQKKTIGALCIVDVKSREFTPNDVHVISTLAKAVSIEEERYNAETEIHNSLEEKEILLKEIHHRVKNNMQIISSLLKLQSSSIQDEKILQLFKESQNRVKTMALIHEKLYSDSNFADIEISTYLKTLVNYLFRNFVNLSSKLDLTMEVDKIMMDIDTAIPCGLIINELVTNAIKYAFPENKKGELTITLESSADQVILIVKDNGIGIPEDFNIEETNTLGFQLVKALVNQLHGTIEINRKGGTELIIKFKMSNKKKGARSGSFL